MYGVRMYAIMAVLAFGLKTVIILPIQMDI